LLVRAEHGAALEEVVKDLQQREMSRAPLIGIVFRNRSRIEIAPQGDFV
jgi:hypothetical protein